MLSRTTAARRVIHRHFTATQVLVFVIVSVTVMLLRSTANLVRELTILFITWPKLAEMAC